MLDNFDVERQQIKREIQFPLQNIIHFQFVRGIDKFICLPEFAAIEKVVQNNKYLTATYTVGILLFILF